MVNQKEGTEHNILCIDGNPECLFPSILKALCDIIL